MHNKDPPNRKVSVQLEIGEGGRITIGARARGHVAIVFLVGVKNATTRMESIRPEEVVEKTNTERSAWKIHTNGQGDPSCVSQ